MFHDRFSEDASRVMDLARAAAIDHGYELIGVEHVLLGLSARPQCTAAQVLREVGVQPEAVRAQAGRLVDTGERCGFVAMTLTEAAAEIGRLASSPEEQGRPFLGGFTWSCQRVLERAVDTADQLGHRDIGTGHLLIGILAEESDPAARSLIALGVELLAVRSALARLCPRGARSAVPRNVAAVEEALERARDEAERRQHAGIDGPHVLLALLESDAGFAAQLVRDLGLVVEAVRARVRAKLDGAR